jgi:hypothetical protein
MMYGTISLLFICSDPVLAALCLPDRRFFFFGEQGIRSGVHTDFWVQYHNTRGEHDMGCLVPSVSKCGTLPDLWVGDL